MENVGVKRVPKMIMIDAEEYLYTSDLNLINRGTADRLGPLQTPLHIRLHNFHSVTIISNDIPAKFQSSPACSLRNISLINRNTKNIRSSTV